MSSVSNCHSRENNQARGNESGQGHGIFLKPITPRPMVIRSKVELFTCVAAGDNFCTGKLDIGNNHLSVRVENTDGDV